MCGNRAKVPRDDVYTAPPHHRHFLHFYVMGVLGWLYPLGHPRINLEYSVLPAWQLSLANGNVSCASSVPIGSMTLTFGVVEEQNFSLVEVVLLSP